MKKTIILMFILAIIISCNKKPIVVEDTSVPQKNEAKQIQNEMCYEGILNKDTVAMSLKMEGDKVFGTLTYNYFEKDKNTGTINGIMKGDSLIADYTFNSEGKTSIRQVIFFKKGNTLTEGYGEIIDNNNGKSVFKNLEKIKFDAKIILTTKKCD
ncbi:MAG: hypothetical protein V4548_14165 [Bacteroidota bacterium]